MSWRRFHGRTRDASFVSAGTTAPAFRWKAIGRTAPRTAAPPFVIADPRQRTLCAGPWHEYSRENPMAPRSAAAKSAEKFPTPTKLAVTLFVNGVERQLAVAPWTTLL